LPSIVKRGEGERKPCVLANRFSLSTGGRTLFALHECFTTRGKGEREAHVPANHAATRGRENETSGRRLSKNPSGRKGETSLLTAFDGKEREIDIRRMEY